MARKLLSVVLFCRNCEATLQEALDSVVSQEVDVELLVLDGGSADRSIEIIRRYEAHISFWRSFADGSSTNAINEGVKRATGDVIGLLAGDDWYERKSLRTVIQCFQNDPELGLLSCGTRFAYFDEHARFRGDKRFVHRQELSFELSNLFRNPLTCGRFIKRAYYEALGGYDGSYKSSDDLDFLIRLCLSRPKTDVNPQLTYSYRAHPGSRTLSGHADVQLLIARDNVTIAERYLRNPELTVLERRALLALHGKFAARATWQLVSRWQLPEGIAFMKRALKTSSSWPFMLLYWSIIAISLRLRDRLRSKRARAA